MDMRALLECELRQRKERNPRYSLRAFALSLRTHHSTLSQILQGRRRLTPRSIRQFGPLIGLTPAQIREACLSEHCASIRRLVDDSRFRADSRWIAAMAGIPLDDVNIALHRLLYRGDLVMTDRNTWIGGGL
jgi:hypothetical protein